MKLPDNDDDGDGLCCWSCFSTSPTIQAYWLIRHTKHIYNV